MTCPPLPSCCDYHAAQLPDGCHEGRLCPARADNTNQKEIAMSHVITTKPSNERTPRLERDAKFHWAPGAKSYRETHRLGLIDYVAIAVTIGMAVFTLTEWVWK